MSAPDWDTLATPARDLAETSLAWLDARADPETGLFRRPDDDLPLLRESAWCALGWLWRDAPGDRARAAAVLERACAAQWRAPGAAWDGSFARTPHEAPPDAAAGRAREWIDYDPNWRQFLGTALALARRAFGERLPGALAHRLDAAVEAARRGEPPSRVTPHYSNIALLQAWLDVEAGDPRGLALARAVVERFDAHGAFDEFGSPTYYGVDLFALALWRSWSDSDWLREQGARLEAALWRDVARFYHAGLRNLAGPYTRAYGMDLRRYASLLGVWIWAAAGSEHAPFPDPAQPFAHAHDFALAPVAALVGARVPDDALPHLRAFRGERRVERRIADAPPRTATAWLADDVMLGAEASPIDWRDWEQVHPATIHWRLPAAGGDAVGWLRLRHDGPVDARAEPGALHLGLAAPSGRRGGGSRLEICAPGAAPEALAGVRWRLPGLALAVSGDADPARVEVRDETLCVHFAPGDRRLVLRVSAAGG